MAVSRFFSPIFPHFSPKSGKCRFEPTFKKARPARLSERKSLISSGFLRVRGLQKRPQTGHPRHNCIKDSKSSCPQGHVGSNPTVSAIKSLKTLGFQGLPLFLNQFSDMPKTQNGAHGARACGARPANEIFGIFLPWCPNGARAIKMDICRFMVVYRKKYTFFLRSKYLFDIIDK